MASVSREDLMLYAREDDEAMGELLLSFADAAESYLAASGVGRTEDNGTRYELAVKAMALHFRDHPDGGTFSAGLRTLINQLKMDCPSV